MSNQLEVATVGGGCFWCLEAIFQEINGVHSVVSGYAGGKITNPTYHQVCSGRTGHAEVTQITFDPQIISYADLLYIFWRIHNPTTPNRQGADVGSQYRSIILYHNEEQKGLAEMSKNDTNNSRLWPVPIVTEISALDTFYPAENYHQNYYRDNPNQPYCQVVIDPKVRKFRKSFQANLKQPA